MTTAMITFKYQGNGVVFDSTEKMWNLTEMHRAVGSPKNKAPYEWLRQQQAQEYITALAEQETTGLNRSFVETREGRNGGTWAHWQIAAAYAHYLDARFYLQWNEWAMERAQQIADGDGAAPLARVVALEERVAVLEGAGVAPACQRAGHAPRRGHHGEPRHHWQPRRPADGQRDRHRVSGAGHHRCGHAARCRGDHRPGAPPLGRPLHQAVHAGHRQPTTHMVRRPPGG